MESQNLEHQNSQILTLDYCKCNRFWDSYISMCKICYLKNARFFLKTALQRDDIEKFKTFLSYKNDAIISKYCANTIYEYNDLDKYRKYLIPLIETCTYKDFKKELLFLSVRFNDFETVKLLKNFRTSRVILRAKNKEMLDLLLPIKDITVLELNCARELDLNLREYIVRKQMQTHIRLHLI